MHWQQKTLQVKTTLQKKKDDFLQIKNYLNSNDK